MIVFTLQVVPSPVAFRDIRYNTAVCTKMGETLISAKLNERCDVLCVKFCHFFYWLIRCVLLYQAASKLSRIPEMYLSYCFEMKAGSLPDSMQLEFAY